MHRALSDISPRRPRAESEQVDHADRDQDRQNNTGDPPEYEDDRMLDLGVYRDIFAYKGARPEIERNVTAYSGAGEAQLLAEPQSPVNVVVAAYYSGLFPPSRLSMISLELRRFSSVVVEAGSVIMSSSGIPLAIR